VYAVGMNHRKERHLNGTVLLSSDTISRPSLLITNAIDEPPVEPKNVKLRDQAIIGYTGINLRFNNESNINKFQYYYSIRIINKNSRIGDCIGFILAR
jgi:hypothetical protein